MSSQKHIYFFIFLRTEMEINLVFSKDCLSELFGVKKKEKFIR